MPTIRLSAADVHHRVEGDGLPLVFLHGAGGTSLSWFQQVPFFSAAFTCAVLDQPGWGASRWRNGPVEFTDVLEEYVSLHGWKRVAVVAHSLGGWAALRLTLRKPSRTAALVLSSTWAGIQSPEILSELDAREARLHAARSAWRRQDPRAFMPGCGARMAQEQPALHWLAASIAALNRDAVEAVWRRDADGEFDPILNPKTDPAELGGWSVPTLCLTGEEDFVVPPGAVEAAAGLLNGAELVKIPRTGHSVFLERPARFNELVRSFLGRHAEAPSVG
jgi:pimeloyl-ACP methyl ester carboxylesterase